MKNSENVDKIFSDGLQRYERQPRPQAWEKLEARLQKPKSKVLPIWWKYASAASVALLLGVGGYWFGSQEVVSKDVVAVDTKPSSTLTNPNNQAIEPLGKMPKNNNFSQNTISLFAKKRIALYGAPQCEDPLIEEKGEILEEIIEYPSEKQESIQIAQNSIPEVKKIAPEANTIILVLENTLKPKIEGQTIVLNMVETKPEIVAQTDLNDGITKKETRISKIWQQLKRAKNGENVNWSEVGIKPQKMLARADAKIENVLTKGESNEQ